MISLALVGGIACVILAIVLPLTVVKAFTCGSLVWSNGAQACVSCDAHHHCASGSCGAGNVCDPMTCNTTANCLPGYVCQSGICNVRPTTAAVGDLCTSATLPVNPQFCDNTAQLTAGTIDLPAKRSKDTGVLTNHYGEGQTRLGMVPVYSRGDTLFNVAVTKDLTSIQGVDGTLPDGSAALAMSVIQVQQVDGVFRLAVPGMAGAVNTPGCVGLPVYTGPNGDAYLYINPPDTTCAQFTFVTDVTAESLSGTYKGVWTCGSADTQQTSTTCLPLSTSPEPFGGFDVDFFIVGFYALIDGTSGNGYHLMRSTADGTTFYAAVMMSNVMGSFIFGVSEEVLLKSTNYLLPVVQSG